MNNFDLGGLVNQLVRANINLYDLSIGIGLREGNSNKENEGKLAELKTEYARLEEKISALEEEINSRVGIFTKGA